MSGSGGGSGGGGSTPRTRCEDLTFETQLQSVQQKVARLIARGDKLAIATDAEQRVIARHAKHGIVGAIIGHVPQLLRCMEQGHKYVGTVVSVELPNVMIRVSSR